MENRVLILQKSDLMLKMFDAQNVSHIRENDFNNSNKIRKSAIFYKKKLFSLSNIKCLHSFWGCIHTGLDFFGAQVDFCMLVSQSRFHLLTVGIIRKDTRLHGPGIKPATYSSLPSTSLEPLQPSAVSLLLKTARFNLWNCQKQPLHNRARVCVGEREQVRVWATWCL